MLTSNEIQPLYDQNGQLHGVYIAASKWFTHEADLEKILFSIEANPSVQDKSQKEPIADWKTFLSFWDFNYPVEKSVKCDNCGSSTEDWTLDDPKKFLLKAANLGGLVSFQCLDCKHRVSKKHFKDHICYECTPYGCKVK